MEDNTCGKKSEKMEGVNLKFVAACSHNHFFLCSGANMNANLFFERTREHMEKTLKKASKDDERSDISE